MTEDEMFGWHHRLHGHEFEQALGDGEAQGSLVGYCLQGRKESDMIDQLNSNTYPKILKNFQREEAEHEAKPQPFSERDPV